MSAGVSTAIIAGGALAAGGAIGGSLISGSMAAGAAQSSANAQAQVAQASLAQQQQQFNAQMGFAQTAYQNQQAARQQALQLAQPSPGEIGAQMQQLELQNAALTSQMGALQRNQSMLDSVDPAIKQAGQQALQLLQGQQAAAIAPMQAQRDRQRSQMEQTLAQQLGPDYATSSAGQQALRNFDNDTSTQMAGIQQQTLGMLLGTASQNRINPTVDATNAFAGLSNLNMGSAQLAQGQIGQQVNAFLGAPVNQQLSLTPFNYQPSMQAAQAQGQAGMIQAQMAGNAFGGLSSLGGSFLGYGMQSNLLGQQNQNFAQMFGQNSATGAALGGGSGYTASLNYAPSTPSYSLEGLPSGF